MEFEVIADQLRRCLGKEHLQVLADLFQTMPSYDEGVDVLRFDVKHHRHEAEVHDLYRRSLLLRVTLPDSTNIYRPSLLAISIVEGDAPRSLENTCDAVIRFLHSTFSADPYVVVSVPDIKKAVACSEDELFDALRYVRDMPLGLIAISNDLVLSDTANIPIIKTIMQYPTLLHVYEQLLDWATVPTLDTQSLVTADDAPIESLTEHLDELLVADNHSRIDAEILRVIRELRIALFKELRTLSAVGIRTVIDMIVDDHAGRDLGSFRKKVQWLKENELISEPARKHLLEVLDMGSSAAHRGYNPTTKHLETALMMLSRLVSDIYTMPDRIGDMKRDKPPRSRQRKKR